MLEKNRLHLKGAYTEAGAFYKVIGSAFKPKITVFIPIGGVSRVVNSVLKNLGRFFFIFIITAEHSKGNLFIQTQDDFSRFSCLARRSVGADNIYLIAGGRLSHRAGFYFHAGEGSCCEGKLCLPVAFPQFYSGLFFKGREDVHTKGLPCRCTFFQ